MSYKIQSFITLRILVTNVSESKSWYKKLFNIDPLEDTENFVSFNINGTFLDIIQEDIKNPMSTGGSIGYWLVDNLDELLLKVENIGGKIYRGPLKVPEIQRTIVQIEDPFGNVVGFESPF